jgi:hypothetical protein
MKAAELAGVCRNYCQIENYEVRVLLSNDCSGYPDANVTCNLQKPFVDRIASSGRYRKQFLG